MAENFEPNALFKPVNRTPWQDFWHHFRRNRPAMVGIVVVLLLGLVAISASIGTTGAIKAVTGGAIEGANPNASNVDAQFVPPFSYGNIKVPVLDDAGNEVGTRLERKFYLLGTDDLGRDSLLRLWTGSTVSLLVGFVSVGISVLIGILVGGIAGFYGRGKVTLPFLMCLAGLPLSMLFSSFRFMNGAEHIVAGAFSLLALVSLLAIVVGAVLGRAWKPLAIALVGAILAGVFFVWPGHLESQGAAGEALGLHRRALAEIVEVRDVIRSSLNPTSDYERMNAALGAGRPGVSKQDVDAAADIAGRTQAQIDVALAGLALTRSQARLASAKAAIADAEIKIREEQGRKTAGETEEEIRQGAIKAAEASKIAAEKSLPSLEEAMAKATAELDKAKSVEKVAPGLLKPFKDLQLLKAEQNKLKAPHQRAEKQSLEQLVNSSALYSFTQKLPILIIVGFLCVLAFLLLTQAGQMGARRNRVLNSFFVPVMTVDNFAMRSVEVLMTMPTLVLLLTIVAFYDRDVWLVMFVIGILSWMGTARFVRAEILSLRERDFISAARSLGLSDAGIIVKHLVPNALSPVLVSATIGVAGAIILESTLSFLGLGAAPDQVTWGKMLAESRQYITHAPWLFITPGVAILVVVLAFNLLGEGLREAMNPKLRKR